MTHTAFLKIYDNPEIVMKINSG